MVVEEAVVVVLVADVGERVRDLGRHGQHTGYGLRHGADDAALHAPKQAAQRVRAQPFERLQHHAHEACRDRFWGDEFQASFPPAVAHSLLSIAPTTR